MTRTAVAPAREAAHAMPAPGRAGSARPRRRRWRGWAVAAVAYAVVATWSVHLKATESTEAFIDLYLDGVHLQADGTVADVRARRPATYLHGSRVLAADADDPAAQALAREQRDWLAAGTLPGAGTRYEGLVESALLDIRTLTGAAFEDERGTPSAPGAAVAGWTDRWRYVWPRDASFVAAALARTGHPEDAVAVLGFVRDVQTDDGGFQARYLADASGVPDSRGVQLDGNGWVLWSAATVLDTIEDPVARRAALTELRPLVDRSVDHVLVLTDAAPHLPPPSSDYWEVREDELTLGTVAPLLAGLEHAAALYDDAGEPRRAAAAAERAAQLRSAVEEAFRPDGYTRYAGDAGPMTTLLGGNGRDAATAMLLPPFTTPLPGAEEAWLASVEEMARPAGGVAPGAGWKRDGISWTPETTLYALVAASSGHHELAAEWLDWVSAHRTGSGAIPEKVLANGAPAAVAPLSWSSANVVLAVAALEDAGAL
ncbi:glycoside hydrolase family 15 protein [Georgenia yuyongxinii]|uniref:Glycoside hydrolase family 15 n=1 Tax=Georgenia yuyongxinii TaxID=2589797 RepID=A0A552WRM9_9MICO|nr:glycoside hydrolase family 15 protein [Georgenia yuyongxinii]TRW45384.1 glycoside hydrolase family 15 [Georgenia yuyongxinii]